MKGLFTYTLCWLMAFTCSYSQVKSNYEYSTSMPYGTLDIRTRISSSNYYYLEEGETFSFRENSSGVRTNTYVDMTGWDSSPYDEGHLRHKVGTADDFVMNYRLLMPNGYNSSYSPGYPLIVHLHGAHERANCLYDNCYHSDWDYTVQENSPPAPTSATHKLLNNDHNLDVGGKHYMNARNLAGTRLPDDPSMPNRAFQGFVVAPQMFNSWDSLQVQDVVRIVRLLADKYNVDEDRIYLQGLSIGGYGVFEAMKRASWLFAAALPMSAVWDANIFTQNQQGRVAHMPIWIFQGGNDKRPSPAFTQNIINKLENAGAEVRYSLYSDLGHVVWYRAYGQSDYFAWILEQNKANLHVSSGNTVIDRSKSQYPKLMLAEGFLAYQWEKDGDILGNTANTLTVTTPGRYRARFSRKSGSPTGAQWNRWSQYVTITETDSPTPVVSVSITNPDDGQSFTAPASINFTATASVSDGSLSKVEFYNGGTKLGEDSSSPYSFTWSNVSAGSYVLIAKAIENSGGSATDRVEITVNPDSPTPVVSVSITNPDDGQSFTAPASINFTATASVSDGSLSKVEFYNGGTKLGEDSSSPYSFTWSNVSAGSYALIAKAIENSGESATDRVEITVNPGSDDGESCASTGSIQVETWTGISGREISSIPVNSSPASVTDLTIFETDANIGDNYGSRVRGYVCAPTTGNYTFWIASNDSGELWLSTDEGASNKRRIAYVSSYTNPRQWDKLATQRSAAVSLVAGRKYYIEALLKEGTGSDHLSVGWQLPGGALERPIPGRRLIPFQSSANNPPTVSLTNPDDGETFTAPASIGFTATASDSDGSVSKVEFYNGGTKLGEDSSSPYSFTWSNVSAGNYALIAKATDNSGESATDRVEIIVNPGSPTPVVSVTITNPDDGQSFTAPASISLTATASVSDGSVSKVEFYNGGTKLGEDSSSPYSFTWSNVSAGSYALIAKAIENSGESATDRIEITVNPESSGGGSCASTGNIQVETWTGIPGRDISSIPLNSSPASVSNLSIFETQANIGDHYGSRVRGYICVPTTGTYTFWIASNDSGELWLSTDENASNKRRIAYVSSYTNPRQWDKLATQRSAAVSLVADRRYYIEALLKEGTGSDHLSVGWQLPGGTLERPIPGSRLISFQNSGNSSPTVNLTNPDDGQSFTAPASIGFTATASDSDGSISRVEFYNGTTKLGQDATSPYTFTWSNVSAGNYSLSAKAIDNSGGAATDRVEVTVNGGSGDDGSCASTGSIQVETWTGIEGSDISSIPLNSSPSSVADLTTFETEANIGDHYGSRVRGYICVPTTGNYTFWIASNDNGELWLSTDESPGNKSRIAYVSTYTNPRQWDKLATQRSADVHLVADRRYYIEALLKEGVGSDHLSVGWQLPGGALERPIPGNRLSKFETQASARAFQSTETTHDATLYSQIAIYPNPVERADAQLTVGGYAGITKPVQTQVEIINLTGEVVFSEMIRCGGDCSDYLISINKQLVPGVYLINLKTNGERYWQRLYVK